MDEKLRRYLAYGLGELVLVVVGILIALQIDNWNEDRKERATLQSYLESISRNMREDLAELEELRAHRHEALWAATRVEYLFNRDRYEKDEIFFLNQAVLLATDERYFSANTSGFEALKVSGTLNRLQGSKLEQLLSAYYDLVSQIGRLEANLYDAVRPISIEMGRDTPSELAGFALVNPAALPDELFEELQPAYSQHVNHPLMRSSFGTVQFRNSTLILNYDGLRVIGEAFIEAVKSADPGLDIAMPKTPIDDYKAGLGDPQLVVFGRPKIATNLLSTANSQSQQPRQDRGGFRFDSVEQVGTELHVDFQGGREWAVVYWTAANISERRSVLDYSRFETLVLEIKGDKGGERINVHVKDADYPDTIAPISVDLELSDAWQTYEIDLDEFSPNDLSRLHVVLGFGIVPAQEPLSFSVRNAEYR